MRRVLRIVGCENIFNRCEDQPSYWQIGIPLLRNREVSEMGKNVCVCVCVRVRVRVALYSLKHHLLDLSTSYALSPPRLSSLFVFLFDPLLLYFCALWPS